MRPAISLIISTTPGSSTAIGYGHLKWCSCHLREPLQFSSTVGRTEHRTLRCFSLINRERWRWRQRQTVQQTPTSFVPTKIVLLRTARSNAAPHDEEFTSRRE